ncbi:PAS domain S-box protein [Pseudomonas sp.]|uniref:PAS domain-containing sensor histidine kinase n=1 Tax=Pseudomonas sp. TaxID=306 RepID=UPI00272F8008|nr:sensor histidine kinase [Pseudomonas sp.]MDP2246387.1 PAS domain S-box protein [Pseudomonas sp.]
MSSMWSRFLFLLLVWPFFAGAEDTLLPLRPLYTAEQQAWLGEHRQLRVGLLMQAPWALYDRRLQRLSGANVELMSRVLKGMGVQPVWLRYADQDELDAALRRGEVDLAPGLQQTPRGLRLWLYSAPYMRVPHLVVSEQRGISAVDLDRLGYDEPVAVREPSAAFEYLYKTHNNLQLQAVSSERVGLLRLLRKEVSYAVVDEARLSLLLREPQFATLSIVGDIGLPQLLRVASRRDEPLLAEIIERTLEAMPGREIERLRERWLPLKYPQIGESLAFWRGLALLLLLALLSAAAIVLHLRQQRRGLERQLLGVRQELSQREVAEQALRLSQFSIDHSTVGILWVNWDSHVRYANRAAEEMLGYASGSLVELPLQVLEPSLNMDRWLSLWKLARSTGEALPGFEAECRRADGSGLPADVSLSFLRFDRAEYLVVFLADVTERRRARAALQESEARLKGIAGNVPGLVFRLERAAIEQPVVFAYISEASAELVGYPAVELQRVDRGIRSLVHPDDQASYRRTQDAALAGDSDWQWQGRIVTRAGQLRWADIKATARRLGEGRVVWDGIVWDITENKQVELALGESRARLRELSAHLESVREEEKARIAREVHDELGQVLTVLKLETAMCELVCSGQMPELDKHLQNMKRLIAQLFQLVRDVASALRPPILDAGIASAIEWQVRRFEARTQIPCMVEVPENLPKLSDAKAIGLFRILQEALTNIMRHAGAHSVQVSLHLEDGELCLCVSDDGKGFAPEQRKPGQSFGLVGMQERVLMLGGQLQIDSQPGEGTTLYARVAVAEEDVV